MKTITKPNTNYRNSLKINEAIAFFRTLINEQQEDRFLVTLHTNQYGEFHLYDGEDEDGNADYGLSVYEHKGDIFFVPGFADETWSGVSLKGQDYTISAEMKPIICEAI
jgi:hypothetical protein